MRLRPDLVKPKMVFAEQLEFQPGVDLDIRYHSRKRDPDGLTMKQRNELERRDSPGVSLLRKRKRKDLSDQEKLDIVEEFIDRKRAQKSVANKFHITEQLVSDLAREH